MGGEGEAGARKGVSIRRTYAELLSAPPAVQDPAHGGDGGQHEDRDDDCPGCADHVGCWEVSFSNGGERCRRALCCRRERSGYARAIGGDVRLRSNAR